MDQPTTARPVRVELDFNGQSCELEVDTGVAVSILSEARVNLILPGAHLTQTNVSLRAYTSEKIPVKGRLRVQVRYGQLSRRNHLPAMS